jgi:hypothetical protein
MNFDKGKLSQRNENVEKRKYESQIVQRSFVLSFAKKYQKPRRKSVNNQQEMINTLTLTVLIKLERTITISRR